MLATSLIAVMFILVSYNSKEIEVRIVDDDEYEKQEEFYIRLCELKDLNENPEGDGKAYFGELVKCTVEITEDHLFKSRTDKVCFKPMACHFTL